MSEELVEHYEVVPGLLFAGEYPGSWEPGLAGRKIRFLLDLGVRVFIDLTTSRDRLEPYEGLLEEHGAVRHSFPVPDLGVPSSDEVMVGVLRTISEANADGLGCYVHCWGGIGRTGTAIGCYLRETGLSGDAALTKVQKLYAGNMPKAAYQPYSPQTRAQSEFVLGWGAAAPGSGRST